MSSTYGENLKLTIFGQSHSSAIGMTLEGVPAGEQINTEELYKFLSRRAPGRNEYSTQRKEDDEPEFLCGIVNETTCGVPITAIIKNSDTRSGDYSTFKDIPRPGHADYTAEVKYGGYQDFAGGGHFSGRLTAPLCIAGGICKQLLKNDGVEIISRIKSVGKIFDTEELITTTAEKDFPVVNDDIGLRMQKLISETKEKGDSVGGIVECLISGVPAGIGDPIFDGMENRISNIVFGIPAVKGIEFGLGFEAAELFGSQNNDSFIIRDGKIETETNNSGGILGGITNGMPITFNVAFKPTPSISAVQKSIDLTKMEEVELKIIGRHDPCIVPRAVPCVEAAAAIAVYDALLGRRREYHG